MSHTGTANLNKFSGCLAPLIIISLEKSHFFCWKEYISRGGKNINSHPCCWWISEFCMSMPCIYWKYIYGFFLHCTQTFFLKNLIFKTWWYQKLSYFEYKSRGTIRTILINLYFSKFHFKKNANIFLALFSKVQEKVPTVQCWIILIMVFITYSSTRRRKKFHTKMTCQMLEMIEVWSLVVNLLDIP